MATVSDIKVSGAGAPTTFSGDTAGLNALGSAFVYDVPVEGQVVNGQPVRYSGIASGYNPYVTAINKQSAAAKLADAAAQKENAGAGAGITGSSGNAIQEESDLGTRISNLSAPTYSNPANNSSYLTDYKSWLDTMEPQIESGIESDYQTQKADLQNKQDNETGSTQGAIMRAGGYLGVSGSGSGVLNNLAVSHRAEMAKLDAARQDALMKAKSAYMDKNFTVAKALADQADELEKTMYSRQQDFFDNTIKTLDEQRAAGTSIQTQNKIQTAIDAGSTDAESIFKALKGSVSIEDISGFLKSATPAQDTSAFKYTTSDIAKLLGTGLSTKDIATVQQYVNEHGYTDDFRSKLTPQERAVMDSIYYPKAPANGVGGTLTISEARQLGLPTSLIGRSQAQVFQDLQGDVPPPWYVEYAQNKMRANIIPAKLAELWQEFRSNILNTFVPSDGLSGSDTGGSGGSTATDEFNSL